MTGTSRSPQPPGGLCILAVHAHPDDEASKGAGTIAKYSEEGVHTVLVTCTNGEEGDILNKAMDRPEVRANLAQVRLDELAASAKIIGYDDVVLLGYRDSGMPDDDANGHPDNFANADVDEAVGRLVAAIREHRPQVIITYNDDQSGYPHPDHLKVHDISLPAFDRAGDPLWYPDLGEPWSPSKIYYTVWSRKRIEEIHKAFGTLGLESPFSDDWFKRPSQDDRITATIDTNGYYDVRKQALLAHATQVDPESPFWFGLPDEVARTIHPVDEYVLAASRVTTAPHETDLFAGLR